MSASLRSCPNLRTAAIRRGVPQADICSAAKEFLFDHLVGEHEQLIRNIQAERFRGLEVDRHFELHRGLNRKLAWLCAFEDAIDIGRRTAMVVDYVISIGQQATDFSELTEGIDGRETVASRQRCNLSAMGDREEIRHQD